MDETNTFVPNPNDGIYHQMKDINEVILESKNNNKNFKECIIKLEKFVGSKGTREFIDVVLDYEHHRLTFDDAVLKFLSFPTLETKVAEDIVNDQCQLLFNQKVAYENLEEESASRFSINQVRYFLQREIFRNRPILEG